MKDMKTKLAESDELIVEKETEIAKLTGELKRLKCEMNQLNRDLTEEREVRQQLKSQSMVLVSEIKTSQKRKVTELEADLEYQKSLVSKRENEICDLEAEISTLRTDVQHFQAELQKAATTTGEIQENAAKVNEYL
jgi:chromosome segregation ATPase